MIDKPKPIIFYATESWKKAYWSEFKKLTRKRNSKASPKLREMVEKYVKINGKGQICLIPDGSVTTKEIQTCSECGASKLFGYLIINKVKKFYCQVHYYQKQPKAEAFKRLD